VALAPPMNRMRAILAVAGAALALLGVVASPAHARKAPPAPAVSPVEQAQLREVARRGGLLYAYDQAAWHGTDDLVAKMPDFETRVGGWIVDGPAEAPELIFFDKDRANPHAVYVARFGAGKLVSGRIVGAGESGLSPERRQLVAAREAALAAVSAASLTRCAESPMNSVVLPPAAPGEPTLVYILTPQRVMNALPFGGHYLIPVDATGSAGPIRHFTNTCLELPLPSAAERPRVVALGITHLLDPLPTEIHVFSSLAAHMPVTVGTSDGRTWWVDGTAIRLIGKAGR
jgi:hypothetical protein